MAIFGSNKKGSESPAPVADFLDLTPSTNLHTHLFASPARRQRSLNRQTSAHTSAEQCQESPLAGHFEETEGSWSPVGGITTTNLSFLRQRDLAQCVAMLAGQG